MDHTQTAQTHTRPRMALLPIRDPGARLYLLTRLILSFDESDQAMLAEFVECGFTPDLIDKLRTMLLAPTEF